MHGWLIEVVRVAAGTAILALFLAFLVGSVILGFTNNGR